MKIVIPGGSGQVGHVIARRFAADNHEVVILSRNQSQIGDWKTVRWDGRTLGSWTSELDGADVIINLAGRSVNCRYAPHNRREIMDSRVDSVHLVGQAIAVCRNPPALWLQASTATIYAHRFDAANGETTGIIGGNEPGVPDTWRFSIDVAKNWELALDEANTPQTRKVKLRSAMTMSPDTGGVFDTLLRLVRFGLGGQSGDGCQFVSWIHHKDFQNALYWLIDHDEIEGAVNISSPCPVTNAAFMKALRQAWGMPIGLPASKWMLEIGALVLRTETELILKSRRVVPEVLLNTGFEFTYPEWPAAADELCHVIRQQIAPSATP